jgi:hypothetical protein
MVLEFRVVDVNRAIKKKKKKGKVGMKASTEHPNNGDPHSVHQPLHKCSSFTADSPILLADLSDKTVTTQKPQNKTRDVGARVVGGRQPFLLLLLLLAGRRHPNHVQQLHEGRGRGRAQRGRAGRRRRSGRRRRRRRRREEEEEAEEEEK